MASKYILGSVLSFCILLAFLFTLIYSPFDITSPTFFSIKDTKPTPYPNIQTGKEVSFKDYKYSNSDGIMLSVPEKINCRWKKPSEDDGYKRCNVIFEIDDTNKQDLRLYNPDIFVNFFDNIDTRKITISYSQDYIIYNEIHKKIDHTSSANISKSFSSLGTKRISNNLKDKKGEVGAKRKHDNQQEKISTKKDITKKSTVSRRRFTNFKKLESKLTSNSQKENEPTDNNSKNISIKEKKSPLNKDDHFANISENDTTKENSTLLNRSLSEKSDTKDSDLEDNMITQSNTSDSANKSDNKTIEEEHNTSLEKKVFALTGLVTRYFKDDHIDTNKPFAVNVSFEIPKHEEVSFDFRIKEEDFEAYIDPTITGCGILDEEGATYQLNQYVTSSATCFEITADNIVLDCDTNNINYGGSSDISYGVYVNATNVTVKNCRINKTNSSTLSGSGIFIDKKSSAKIHDNTLHSRGNYVKGIFLNSSNDSIIYNNNIYSYDLRGHGIHIGPISSNISLNENNIESFGHEGYGIYLEDTTFIDITSNQIYTEYNDANALMLSEASSNTISENFINTTGSSAHGIKIENGRTNNLSFNEVYTYGSSGNSIHQKSSQSNTIKSNNISCNGIYGSAYYLSDNSFNNSFTRNLVSGEGDDRYGIFLDSSTKNNISSNIIDTRGDYGYGILVYNASDNVYRNLTINTFGDEACGIFLDHISDNNSFYTNNVNSRGNKSSALYVWYRGHNFSFYDSNLTSLTPGVQDIYFDAFTTFDQPGHFNLYNVSYESDYWSEDANGHLNRYWYLKSNVFNDQNSPLESANISIYFTNESLKESDLTDSNGSSSFLLLSYTKNASSSLINHSHYLIKASYEDSSSSSDIFISSNTLINMTIENQEDESTTLSSHSSSGGGGSATSSKNQCNATYDCTSWSECTDDFRTRNCTSSDPSCKSGQSPPIKKECIQEKNIKGVLFDIKIEHLDKKKNKNKDLSFLVSLLNIGEPGKVNASLLYDVFDNKSKKVYSEKEIVLVETQREFIKEFSFSNLSSGEYEIYANLTYKGQNEPASSHINFNIKEDTHPSYIIPTITYIIPTIILLIITFFLVKLFKKRLGISKKLDEEISHLKDDIDKKDIDKIKEDYSRIKKEYSSLSPKKKRYMHKKLYPLLQKIRKK